MATLTSVAVNGDVGYFKEDGTTWDHNAGVHANSNPPSAHPQPTDNNMSWTETTAAGADVNQAVMTSMEEDGDVITLKGNCTHRHSVKLASGAPKVEMTLLVKKTGGKQGAGEAAAVYSDAPQREPIYQSFWPYVTIKTT